MLVAWRGAHEALRLVVRLGWLGLAGLVVLGGGSLAFSAQAQVGQAAPSAETSSSPGVLAFSAEEIGRILSHGPWPPAPAPAPAVACASYSNLGGPCDQAKGICCGGGPKNAKCSDGKICVTTYPTGRRFI